MGKTMAGRLYSARPSAGHARLRALAARSPVAPPRTRRRASEGERDGRLQTVRPKLRQAKPCVHEVRCGARCHPEDRRDRCMFAESPTATPVTNARPNT